MKVFGFEITRTRTKAPSGLMIPESRGGWYPIVKEGFAGAWQTNVDTPLIDVLSHPTVFACVTLIANDISKMRCELVVEREDDVWEPIEVPAFSPVLREPNGFQVPLHFFRSWFLSINQAGNTYALKVRDERAVVRRMYVLDPWRVRPLVSPDGSVFYELKSDVLNQVPESPVGGVVVPASEIMHDLVNPLFHPLVGISPLYAAGIPAILGLKIQVNSTHFFGNGSQPGGLLIAPTNITDEQAARLKTTWETNFTGSNAGKIAVIGNEMKYQPMSQPANDAQLPEQWLAASQAIADAFHVPFYLVGGPMPNYNNIQAQNVQYFTQCLQPLTVSCEQVLDKGLGLSPDRIDGKRYGTQFNVNDLLWMDSATMMAVQKDGVAGGLLTPNEGRASLNRGPKEGGDSPYLQQQYFSLEALARRDAAAATPPPDTPAVAVPDDMPEDMPPNEARMSLRSGFTKRREKAA